MRFIYNTGIWFFDVLLLLASPFNEKARQMRRGRKEAWARLKEWPFSDSPVWIHCASLGEFEQGRPIIEALKEKHPGTKVLLTFFSPSGYEVRKNYKLADLVVYLPADTPAGARRFIKRVKPQMAIFIKYEFWPNYFRALQSQGISIYSVSAIFRENQHFFKWYGAWFRKTLALVTKFYVQDPSSGQLLKSIGIDNYAVTGDTRFDRVAAIVKSAVNIPEAADFAAPADAVLVAGSTWPPDEEILARYVNASSPGVRMIIAPHEVHEEHITRLIKLFTIPAIRYSQLKAGDLENARVLIIDGIGMLSALYRYGQVAYIGGGFGKGIHNTLEAATYGMPVVFGPGYHKFKEAIDLIEKGGAFSIESYEAFVSLMEEFNNDPEKADAAGKAAGDYTRSMCGATDVIMEEVF